VPKKKPAAVRWPADQVERVKLSALVPYARNAKLHPDWQVAQIRASMREFGWTMAVLRDEHGGIIAGHGRVLAAHAEVKAGNREYESVPTVTARGWSEAKKRAYRLADNKLTMNGGWDDELALAELDELIADGYDTDLTGFAKDEIDDLRKLADELGAGAGPGAGLLADRFGVPPFSVLNAREGWWQDRKKAWLSLGIQSEVGRGENLLQFSESVQLGGKIQAQQARKRKAKAKGRAPAKRPPAGEAHASA
jgi:ParB-like chromosome segregation protein Spo0J